MAQSTVRALVRSAVELTSRHDRDAVLDTILGELERLVPFDTAAVLQLEGDALGVVAARGFRRDVDLAALRYGRGANPRLDRALLARGTIRFTDPDEADPFDGLTMERLEHFHSCMAAPMRIDGKLIGLITADAHERRRFDERHAELLELFAALSAVAIRNAATVSELERARAQLQGEVATLAAEINVAAGTALVGESGAMRALRSDIALVGPADTTVLITGETGTGKELVARALHAVSSRRERPLICFDASSVAPSLVESELYGHARGAFTGASEARPGRFEVADGSTLFLDEIGELPLEIQPRLLRALQEHEVERVGENRVRRFDARVIAATNRDLQKEVRAGRFRADLFHRLAVYPIHVPALRERLDDVVPLVHHFARKLAPRLQLASVEIAPSFFEALRFYEWPGNVRELENTVERALVRSRRTGRRTSTLDGDLARQLGLSNPPAASVQPARDLEVAEGRTLRELTDEFQRRAVQAALSASGDNAAAAARRLGLDRSNFARLVDRLSPAPKSRAGR